jgi:hypothetical protein
LGPEPGNVRFQWARLLAKRIREAFYLIVGMGVRHAVLHGFLQALIGEKQAFFLLVLASNLFRLKTARFFNFQSAALFK